MTRERLAKRSLSARRRWLDRLSTVAVSSGAILVLLAIASIFLFLIWASWPLFWNSDSPSVMHQKIKSPNSIVSALTATDYLVREHESGRYEVISMQLESNEFVSRVSFSEATALIATDSGNPSVLVTVSETGILQLYNDYEWAETSAKAVHRAILEYPLEGMPAAVTVHTYSGNQFHLLVEFNDRLEWLVADVGLTPLYTGQNVTLSRQLRLGTATDADRVHLMAQGRLLLRLTGSSGYEIYERGSLVYSGQLRELQSRVESMVLKSGYGLAVTDTENAVNVFGLTYTEHGPRLIGLNRYHWRNPGIDTVFAFPLGGIVGVASDGLLEWLDTDFGTHRVFDVAVQKLAQERVSRWHLTGDGVLIGFNATGYHKIVIEAGDRRFAMANFYTPQRYEGYSQPKYIWQSMALEPTSEAKFSISPLIVGTLKAAFYSLLFAAPLAIASAIFTSYFLASELRARLKPLVEFLAAIPTVILGLVAGLWFAPWLERNLGLILLSLVSIPICLFVASWIWRQLPGNGAEARLSGFELLFSAVALAVAIALANACIDLFWSSESPNLVTFLAQAWGVQYEQRNAVVVGLAMGFAVIPTIYSIAEDALAAVPTYLREGALAMGASEWQAARSVVLPTAAPGIVSAVMMGFARAIGETMIVLMATGNTATTDWSLLTGLRTLAATLALEMPEVVPDSLHFHVLMFIALQLFIFTFVLNSIAEWIRAGLRKKVQQL